MLKKLAFSLNLIASLAVIAIVVVASPAAPPAISSGAAASGGPGEGIGLHGHWTIEVRDADGSVADRREFDNALLPLGRTALNRILAGDLTPGAWSVTFDGTGGPCDNGSGTPAQCVIAEANYAYPGPNVATNLQLTTPTTGANANKMVFSGNIAAAHDGNVSMVMTTNHVCLSAVAPLDCAGVGQNNITQATLASPVSVVAGQSILVTVTLYFS